MHPLRGEVYWVHLDPTHGAEMKKTRPCLVITDDIVNRIRRTVVIIPLSNTSSREFPIHVAITALGSGSQAVIDQVRAVDKQRFGDRIGTASFQDMERVAEALKIVFAMD